MSARRPSRPGAARPHAGVADLVRVAERLGADRATLADAAALLGLPLAPRGTAVVADMRRNRPAGRTAPPSPTAKARRERAEPVAAPVAGDTPSVPVTLERLASAP